MSQIVLKDMRSTCQRGRSSSGVSEHGIISKYWKRGAVLTTRVSVLSRSLLKDRHLSLGFLRLSMSEMGVLLIQSGIFRQAPSGL